MNPACNSWRFAIFVWLGIACSPLVAVADSAVSTNSGSLRLWRTTEGLPSDSVTAILQTEDSYLWIGTTAGLVRFDGVKFTKLPLGRPLTNESMRVTALCEDSSGNLWIGTETDGLFELSHGVVKHFTREDGLLHDNVTSLAAGGQEKVYIGTPSGLNLWTGAKFEAFRASDGLPDEFVSNVGVARSGTIWITTRVGMCRLIGDKIVPYEFKTDSQGRRPEYLGAYEDRHGNLWAFGDTYLINLAEGKRFNYFRSSESESVRIWSLCEGTDGRLWIGTSGRGLFCFENNRFQPVVLDEDRWPYDVRAIYEDNQNDLWLGTSGGGLIQLRPQAVHVLRGSQGLPDDPPTAVTSDLAGETYVALKHGGLFVGESGHFDRVHGGEELAMPDFVSSLCVGTDGAIWVGTLGDGILALYKGRQIHLTTADGLADNCVISLCSDKAGGVWAGTESGVIHRIKGTVIRRFDDLDGLPKSPVTAMLPTTNGSLWLGTRDGRVVREQNGTFSVLSTAANFGEHAVLALHEDDAGRLWVGSDGGGLTCCLGAKSTNWNTANGLPATAISAILADRENNLWLATDNGIYRIDRSDLEASWHNRAPLACQLMSEAKTSVESAPVFGGAHGTRSADGQLWFVTSVGLLAGDTHQSEIAPPLFPVYLENVTFNGRPVQSVLRGQLWSPPVTNNARFRFPNKLSSLEFRFTGLNFAAPEQLRFRHKLEGFDSDWVDDGPARFARYGRLSYGQYRFLLNARSGSGSWQEPADSFAFVVPTPFYFSWWAIALYIGAAIAAVAGIVRMVSHRRLRLALAWLEQQQSLERERVRIARDMHDEMGSKLTKISFLSERARADTKAGEPLAQKIESIAQTSRELLQTMDEIVWAVNPRNDTLENLTNYFSHYALEYFQNTSIECELRLPRECPACPLSSEARHNLFLTFEEALNNVLKHSSATSARIEISVESRRLVISIVDNGVGFEMPAGPGQFPPKDRGGNGLRNMRQRLLTLGGEFQVASAPGNGTTVTIQLRLPKTG